MRKLATLIFSAMTVGAACGASLADALPEGAVKLSAAEVKAIYSGKSAIWPGGFRGYFSPEGNYIGYGNNYFWDGKWSVSGNEICANSKWTNVVDKKSGTDKVCWHWYKDGKKYWSLWSKEKDKKNGYWDEQTKYLKNSDVITKKYISIKAKYEKSN